MSAEILLLLALGMGNGLLHALDADHVLAVSAVALGDKESNRKISKGILRTAVLWALGHGTSLVVLTTLAIGLGWAIPQRLSSVAEVLVGLILIAAGGAIWAQLWRGRLRISHHRHEGLPPHVHIHTEGHGHRSDHKPVLVGIVHGIAGGAPLLAVLPLMISSQFLLATSYILLFSASVALMMCAFGGLLGSLVRWLGTTFEHGVTALQGLLGAQAIGFGCFWLWRAF